MELTREKLAIIVLSVLLLLAAGYIAFLKYEEQKQQELTGVFNQGVQAGYQQAVILLFQEASTCRQVPVMVQNQTINVFAVECLQQQQKP